jgi:hypothetical protein
MRRSISTTTLVLAATLVTVSRAFLSRQDWSRSRHIHTPTTSRLWGWSQEATVFTDDDDDDDVYTNTPTTATTTPSRMPGWSQQASVVYNDDDDDDQSNKDRLTVSLEDCSNTQVTTNGWTAFDLSSPREWLEHDGCPDGAYTVIRCDLGSINDSNNSNSGKHPDIDWRIWGLDFHLQRLVQSLDGYSQSEGRSAVDDTDTPTNASKNDRYIAYTETKLLIHELLAAADLELSPVLSENAVSGGENSICVAMVTILWSLDPNSSDGTTNRVRVKGHICLANGVPVSADPTKYNPDPIQVALALLPSSSSVSNLPSRKDSYPEAKLSAWCGNRRPLEVQFKSQGVGEVLLVDKYDDDNQGVVHLLEGLTSNLFVLYPDNVLRTAATGVLQGYARQLVLEQAERLGLTPDFTPIRLDESDMWLDCFVTSSIKLIAPVGKILVPVVTGEDGTNTELQEMWSRSNVANSRSVWRELYNGIMLDSGTH